MDRATKNKILIRYVSILEDKHGSIRAAEENGDKQFKEMRKFVKRFFNDRDNESSLIWRNSSRWTKEEVDAYLKEYYATKDTDEIADELGMSPEQVRSKAWYLGLKKPKIDKSWIESFIIKNHKGMSRKEMSRALGLPYTSVCRYVRTLKKQGKISAPLLRPSEHNESRPKKWTTKEEEYLVKYYSTTSVSEIAKALGRSDNAIRVKAHKMGINNKRG